MADEHDSDRGGPVWGPLLDESHLVAPDALPRLVADVATRIGAHDLTVLLVDHAQTVLLPFPPQRGADEEGIAIDATVAGRAFRRVQAQEVPAPDGRRRVWVPVVDGTDRLGVVGVTVAEHDERLADQLRQLAALLAYLITSKTAVGDAIVRAGRRRPMDLAAELQWQLKPPLTVATRQIANSAMLEPA